MRKRILSLILIAVLFLSLPAFALADNREVIVYIASGSSSAYRYHRTSSCSSLSRSTVAELTLWEAASRGFTPCSRCNPPIADFDVDATPRPITPGESSGSSASAKARLRTSPVQQSPSSSTQSQANRAVVRQAPDSAEPSSDIAAIVILISILFSLSVPPILLVAGGKAEKTRRIKEESRKRMREAELQAAEESARRKALFVEKARREAEERQNQFEETRRAEEAVRLAKEAERLRRREAWDQQRSEYMSKFGNRSSLECAGAPDGCALDRDGLPCSPGEPQPWGPVYTFYRTPRGKTYHKGSCRFVQRKDRVALNAYKIDPWYLSACSYCQPRLPDMSWIKRYKEIKRIREKYQISEPDPTTKVP